MIRKLALGLFFAGARRVVDLGLYGAGLYLTARDAFDAWSAPPPRVRGGLVVDWNTATPAQIIRDMNKIAAQQIADDARAPRPTEPLLGSSWPTGRLYSYRWGGGNGK